MDDEEFRQIATLGALTLAVLMGLQVMLPSDARPAAAPALQMPTVVTALFDPKS